MAYSKAWIQKANLRQDLKHMVAVTVWQCPHCRMLHTTLMGEEPKMPFCWECGLPVLSKPPEIPDPSQAEIIARQQQKHRMAEALERSGMAVIRNNSMDMICFADMHKGSLDKRAPRRCA